MRRSRPGLSTAFVVFGIAVLPIVVSIQVTTLLRLLVGGIQKIGKGPSGSGGKATQSSAASAGFDNRLDSRLW